jgi:hypothetical protein
MFGFDSSMVPTENLWLSEKARREEWCLRMQTHHHEAWIGLLQELRECVQPNLPDMGREDSGQEEKVSSHGPAAGACCQAGSP